MKKGKSILAKEEKDPKKATKKIAFQDSKKDIQNQNRKIERKKTKKKTQRDKNIHIFKKELKPSEFPESIAGIIINKLISYAIYKTTVNEIYTHMDEKCYNYLKYLISPYLSTEYIFYEDGIEDINHQKTKVFYKAPAPKKTNTWICIEEPGAPEIDRYASSTTKIVSCKTDINDNNKDNIVNIGNKDYYNQNAIDLKNIRRRSTVVDANLIVHEAVEFPKRKISGRPSSILSISNNNNQNDNLEKSNKVEKNKKEEEKILELTWVDLPKEKYENKYVMKNSNEEYNQLRKERETLILRQSELKALKEVQDKKEKLKKFHSRMQKIFDGSRQTFDANGNIINIHPFPVDNLINDFCFIKIPNIDTKIPQKDIRKNSLFLNKSKLLIKQKSINKNFLRKKTLKKSKTLKNKNKMSEDTKEIFKYLRNVLLPKWQHKPIKKEFYEDEEGQEKEEREKQKILAKKPFKEFFGQFLQDYIFKVNIEHNPIDKLNNNIGYNKYDISKRKVINPSGPNFSQINPEVGVVIENNNNEKTKEIKDGGFEFIKKYNKPSMYEFSKLIMETSQINSSKVLSSGLIESKINEINEINNINRKKEQNKEDYNYNGYMMEFSDINNPLFQGALSINERNRIFSSISKKENENNLEQNNLIKGRNEMKSMDERYKNKYNSMNSINMSNNSIQLTNKVKAPNLYSYFQETKKEPEKNLYNNIDDNNDEDLRKDYNSLQKEKKLERNSALPIIRVRKKEINRFYLNELKNQIKGRRIINKFNYKIINNKKWGEEDEKKKKEREMLNFGLDNRNKNNSSIQNIDINRIQLKKVGENIMNINDDKYSMRSRRAHLFRSSSAGNIF